MKNLIRLVFIIAIGLLMNGCFASKSYLGKVNVVAVGAGERPTNSNDSQYINEIKSPNVLVAYTPKISVTEQAVNDTVKFIAGEQLIKSFNGEPKLLVDYLNSYQKLENKVLILDKNGVVAWSGKFNDDNIDNAQGVFDYGFTGADKISFKKAMEKFVIDKDTADFDNEKKIEFPKGNKDSFLSGFSYSTKYPMLLTKLPDMTLKTAKGDTSLSKIISNKKPTVIILFMSQAKKRADLMDYAETAGRFSKFLTGTGSNTPSPQKVVNYIQEVYLVK